MLSRRIRVKYLPREEMYITVTQTLRDWFRCEDALRFRGGEDSIRDGGAGQ